MTHARRNAANGARGASLVEILVALGIFAIVAGIVFSLFSWFGRTVNTEGDSTDMQQAARTSLDEISRGVQQTGYGIARSDPHNLASWQKDVVHADSYTFAFNADVDPAIGPLSPSESVPLPGELYAGEGTSSSTHGAETYVFTLDADGDGAVNMADRTAIPAGQYNPAAETENPLDFAVFRRVHGYEGGAVVAKTTPVSGSLFTDALDDARFPDGTTPAPLFSYWITEDLDGSGTLDTGECVVTPCPPNPARSPALYLWGDTDFDGKLSETEKTVLRTQPVGSPGWPKNLLANGGALRATALSRPVSLTSASPDVLGVVDTTGFVPGFYVRVGAGTTAESFVIESVNAVAREITLSVEPNQAHGTGEAVTVLPQTLLRAIRTVQLSFSAIARHIDQRDGAAVAGRLGRRGTRGLDYRVESFGRAIELVNLQTTALAAGEMPEPPPICPVSIAFDCGGGAPNRVDLFVPSSAVAKLRFKVTDSRGRAMNGVPVDFTQSTTAAGTLSARTAKSGADGYVAVDYTPISGAGADEVTATATCVNAASNLSQYSTEVEVRTNHVQLDLAQDCLATVHPNNPLPAANYTVSVVGAAGNLANVPVTLGLDFQAAFLPPSGATGLEAELVVGSTSAGRTGSSGSLPGFSASTGSSGSLSGQVLLRRDQAGTGSRVHLSVTPEAGTCTPAGSAVSAPLTYYLLALDSETPRSGCTEVSPCSISSGSVPPTLAARLTCAGQAAANAPVQFAVTDSHAGTGRSILLPGPSVTTGSDGAARVQVANNADGSISSTSPLTSIIDASSTGDPASCSAGAVSLASLRSELRFEGTVAQCDTEAQQAWLSRVGTTNDRLCLRIRNANPPTGCALRPTGIAVTVYRSDGVTPDNIFRMERIEGGAIDSAPNCSTTGKVTLFTSACNGNAFLANGQRWNFTSANGCSVAPRSARPGEYFVFNLLDSTAAIAGTGRPLDVTLYYQCEGPCPTTPTSRTFRLRAP